MLAICQFDKKGEAMTELSDDDEELLELVVLEVPWYMVCGDFHERYGTPGRLAERLLELHVAGLLTIRPTDAATTEVTAQQLERDALDHGCFDDVATDWESLWDIKITETGFSRIEKRLKAQ